MLLRTTDTDDAEVSAALEGLMVLAVPAVAAFEDRRRFRCRVDGVLRDFEPAPWALCVAQLRGEWLYLGTRGWSSPSVRWLVVSLVSLSSACLAES